MSKIEKIAILIIIILILLEVTVSACFSPADPYAMEVVLNKPGVTYDLTVLAEMENVKKIDGSQGYSVFVYKSHYNDELIVIVSEQGLKYARVKTQEEPLMVVSIKGVNITLEELEHNVKGAMNEIDWSIDIARLSATKGMGFVFTKMVDDAEVKIFVSTSESSIGKENIVEVGLLVKNVEKIDDQLATKIKDEIDFLLEKIKLPQFKKVLRLSLIKTSLVKLDILPLQEVYLTVRVQLPLKEEIITLPVYVCNIEYREDKFNLSQLSLDKAKNLGWSIWVRKTQKGDYLGFAMSKKVDTVKLLVEGKGRENEIFIFLKIINASKLDDKIINEFKILFKTIGFDEEVIDKNCFKKLEESTGSKIIPALDISEEEVREALRTELKWLLDQGVIKGLDMEDIEDIVSASKLGYAGWNSRLVWFNGEWIMYSSMDGAVILKCVEAPPAFFFPEKEYGTPVPEKTQETPLYEVIKYLVGPIIIAVLIAAISYVLIRKKMPVEK